MNLFIFYHVPCLITQIFKGPDPVLFVIKGSLLHSDSLETSSVVRCLRKWINWEWGIETTSSPVNSVVPALLMGGDTGDGLISFVRRYLFTAFRNGGVKGWIYMERDARYSTLSVVIFNQSYRLLLPRRFVNGYRKNGSGEWVAPDNIPEYWDISALYKHGRFSKINRNLRGNDSDDIVWYC